MTIFLSFLFSFLCPIWDEKNKSTKPSKHHKGTVGQSKCQMARIYAKDWMALIWSWWRNEFIEIKHYTVCSKVQPITNTLHTKCVNPTIKLMWYCQLTVMFWCIFLNFRVYLDVLMREIVRNKVVWLKGVSRKLVA